MLNLDLDQRVLARLQERSPILHYDFAAVELPDLPDVPGMISEYERKYLYWHTSKGYTGAGAALEVGTWLGCNTIHLGAGLRDSDYDGTLHCVDKYVWNRYFNADHLKHGLRLDEGDDFQPYFEKNVRPVYPNLKVTKSAF